MTWDEDAISENPTILLQLTLDHTVDVPSPNQLGSKH